MWIFFDGGFVSIVKNENPKEPNTLLVRARDRSDLETFCRAADILFTRIRETPTNDYRFRIVASHVAVVSAMGRLICRIDYPNFKDRVQKSQGKRRAQIYGDVWFAAGRIDTRNAR